MSNGLSLSFSFSFRHILSSSSPTYPSLSLSLPAPFLHPDNHFPHPSLSHSFLHTPVYLPLSTLLRWYPRPSFREYCCLARILPFHTLPIPPPHSSLHPSFFPLSIHLLVSRRCFRRVASLFCFPRGSPRGVNDRVGRRGAIARCCVECRITSGRGAINARIMFNIARLSGLAT